ncbi:MAG: methionyl-tRNA formyltransferase [Pirellulales bacterium]|nr:methionyl-tRNA formyltransferase [Pirellulales bacterium]
MRLVMMGTGPFAAPTFRALFDTSHEVVALVTQPPRPSHARGTPVESPLRPIAREHQTPIFDPESINTPESQAELARYRADLFVVADYGQILARETLALARLGGVNLHGSLLPRYRGAAPVAWAIFHGDLESGVTVIHMTPQLDAGPCLAQLKTPIGPDETSFELEARLAALGAPLVCQTIDQLQRGEETNLPQDPALATKARRLRKSDSVIDWSRPAPAIKNQVRALEPWPRNFTFWHRASGSPLRLIVGRCDAVAESSAATPGTVLAVDTEAVEVATGAGVLRIRELQPAGKRMLPAAEFARGYRIGPGDRLGPETP